MKIAVFGNTYRKETLSHVEILFRVIRQYSVFVIVEEDFLHFMKYELNFDPHEDAVFSKGDFSADIALSVGGDGTFLKTASYIGDKNIPILGINTGRLGFLADVGNNEEEKVLNDILQKKYVVESRTVLQLNASGNFCVANPFALNEIAVLKQDSSSMISVETYINGEHIHTYQADGLIVATPTGSTAYNMSVGGPLMVPQAKNLIISPVASHSMTVRPLVIPDDWEIRLKIKSRSHSYLVSLDGRSQIMNQATELIINKATYTIKVVKTEEHSFFNSLKNKLLWGADKRL